MSTPDIENHIENEVKRRLGRQMRQHQEYTEELRSALKESQGNLIKLNGIVSRLTHEPLMFGTLLRVHNYPDARKFRANDEVIVIDESSPHYQKGGRIFETEGVVVDENGYVFVKLSDDTEAKFSIGLEGKDAAQVRLTQKDDGTFAVVSLDGKPWEVRGIPDLSLNVGDCVKVKPDSKAIISLGYSLNAGPICNVVAVNENTVEVMHKGDSQLVYNPRRIVLEEGDRIATDPTMFCVIEKLPKTNRKRHMITGELTATWDDIGGLESAKQEVRDAIELPHQHPELFKHYGIDPLRGILLYGPPGNGKTLLARVIAWSMANLHGKKAVETGYIYVKAPELLDKWVGNTEKAIHDKFDLCRRHYREHGYKATLVFDEADALLAQRGTRRSSDITDTIVPMFLGEMDGVDTKETEENPLVCLLTNRGNVLDQAVTRPGRISRHIKIERPNELSAIDILAIHTKGMPFQDEKNRMAILAIACSDLFSKNRLLYRVNNEHDFTFGDCASGAMIENIAEIAKMNALHRDLAGKTQTGANIEDFRNAVQKCYREQRGLNHSFDLEDFAEKHGIQAQNMKIERCFGAA